MQTKPKISVIIPVYNSIRYLRKCVESVMEQSYENLEIICIDDGSTDGAGALLDELKDRDSRLVVIHDKNHGESHARNRGLSLASGEYIAFVDCDDWIDSGMYELLITQAVKYAADISACSWYKEILTIEDAVELWSSEEVRNKKKVEKSCFEREELARYVYERDAYRGFSYMWNKLYRREALYREGKMLRFPEDIRLGGDVIFLGEAVLNAGRACYTEEAMYHYRIRPSSASHSENLEGYKTWIYAYEYLIDLYQKEGMSEDIIRYQKRFLAYHASNAAKVSHRDGKTEELRYFQKVMKDYQETYEEMNRDFPERIHQYRGILEL